MMGQLLCHLWGDYILQSSWMANNKRKHSFPAMAHALLYSLCFIPLLLHGHYQGGAMAFNVILYSHFLIDRFGLARYVVWFKNWIGPGAINLPWEDCTATGYTPDIPTWLSTWLLIIADNTLHLTINYLALKYL